VLGGLESDKDLYALLMDKKCRFIITVKWPLLNNTSKAAKINFITSLAMDIVNSFYNVHINEINFDCFRCVI